MSKRKRMRIQFEKNRQEKIMRFLRRRSKRKRKNAKKANDPIYSLNTCELLYEKEFFIKVSEYIINKGDGTIVIDIPNDFSIATNPDEVLYILKKIFCCGINPRVKEIMFDHSRCTNLGIAASTIMDTIVLAAKSYRKVSKKHDELTISGKYPLDDYTKDVFIGSGLVKHLNLNAHASTDKNKIKTFKLVSGKYGTEQSSVISTKLMHYFSKCLETQKYKLTDEGENALSRMFSEVLENCEKHGGKKAIWYALGHYQIKKDYEYGEIQLTIFNFGNSIYEQLCSEDTSFETKQKLFKISNKHKNYFSEGKWTEEMLYTVFSLQEGISRLRDKNKKGYRNRGTGTITLMNTFYKLGHTFEGKEPELEIVSGNTYIKFNGKYKPEKKVVDDDIFENKERQIIAFNQENNIFKPSDDSVMCLKQNFPGTIIAMKFYLDKKYLDSIIKEVKNA
jgi:hypothetical protein